MKFLLSCIAALATVSHPSAAVPHAQRGPGSTPPLVTIDAPGAKETIASAINTYGDIVGRYTDQQDRVHGFLLDRTGRWHTLDAPGATFTIARGLNDRGDVVGRFEGADGIGHGFVFSKGTYRTIDYPGPAGTETFAWSINDAGAVVGRFTLPGRDGPHGFLLVDGKWSRIDYPASKMSAANGINSSGDIVGIWFDGGRNEHSFRLKSGVFSPIDVPGSRRTLVDAVLDSGTVSGTYTDQHGVHRGYVMDARGCVTALDQERYPGLTVVRGLNAKGDLVGRYADAAGIGRGYLIRGYPIDGCQPELQRHVSPDGYHALPLGPAFSSGRGLAPSRPFLAGSPDLGEELFIWKRIVSSSLVQVVQDEQPQVGNDGRTGAPMRVSAR